MSKFLQFLLLTVFVSTVSVAQVKHVPLLEEWTQASCGPCAQFNPRLNEQIRQNDGSIIAIKYQTWWPGYDPMYLQNTKEVENRVSFYPGTNSVPTIRLDGDKSSTGGILPNLTQNIIDQLTAKMSPIDVQVTHDISDAFDSMHINVVIKNVADKTFQASKTYLFLSIVERNINFASPPGNNGEVEFIQVMRKMIPDANGTKIKSFIAKGTEVTYSFSVPMPEYLYNAKEISVVGWVQNISSKEVIQAAESLPLDVEKFNLPDLAVSSKSVGTTGYCDHEFSPELTVSNEGSSDITGIIVGYSIDNGQNFITKTIDEEIKAGESKDYAFNDVTLEAGSVNIQYRVEKPVTITQREVDKLNNELSSPTFTLFELDAFGEEAEFTIEGYAVHEIPEHMVVEKSSTWIITSVDKAAFGVNHNVGGYEATNRSMFFAFASMAKDETAKMTIQKIDLSRAAKAQLSFDWSFSNAPNNSINTLSLQASTDCGLTWKSIWEKQGDELATSPVSTSNFHIPTKKDWTTIEIDLDEVAGSDEVLFQFVSTGAGDGLALGFMDNIKVERIITVANEDISANDNSVSLSPNPVFDVLNIELDLNTQSDVNISIHQMNGQLIDQVVSNETMTSGNHLVQWNTVNALSGQYIVKMATAEKTIIKKFVIVR